MRYNRSVLGMLWCLLQPALMLGVMYVVFSFIFKSSIHNFALYLISGIIMYNFFGETSSEIMASISGNAKLINKVNVPKLLYPLTCAIYGLINLLIAFVPLMFVVLVTDARISWHYLLIPFAVLCTLILAIGIGLILATLMVFFRDTKFLWTFACQILMYATPIFYPIDRIPAHAQVIFYVNPLYHNITFMRTILLGNQVPPLSSFLACLVTCIVPLALGYVFFRKMEDRFILYL